MTQSPGRTQRLRGGTRGAQRLRRASRGSKRRATENARTVYSGVFGPRLTPGVRHCRQEAWPRGPLSRAPCPHRLPGRHALPTGRSGDGSSPGAGEGAWLVCPPGRAAAQLAGGGEAGVPPAPTRAASGMQHEPAPPARHAPRSSAALSRGAAGDAPCACPAGPRDTDDGWGPRQYFSVTHLRACTTQFKGTLPGTPLSSRGAWSPPPGPSSGVSAESLSQLLKAAFS